MDHSGENEQIPTEVLIDVAEVIGERIISVSRFSGGLHVGATLVKTSSGGLAVLKVVSLAHHPQSLDDFLRARRISEHMRACGYPTPAWLGVGSTPSYIWHLLEFIDARPAREMNQSLVVQLMGIIELQAGRATESYNHWSYSSRVIADLQLGFQVDSPDQTHEQSILRHAISKLPAHSPDVAALVDRVRHMSAHAVPPPGAPDMVHADINPGNVLVRDGVVVSVVDIGNAGSGTRATDLVDLVWYSFQDHLAGVRTNVWIRIIDLVGRDQASVLVGTKILHMLEFNTRASDDKGVRAAIERGNRMLDELSVFV